MKPALKKITLSLCNNVYIKLWRQMRYHFLFFNPIGCKFQKNCNGVHRSKTTAVHNLRQQFKSRSIGSGSDFYPKDLPFNRSSANQDPRNGSRSRNFRSFCPILRRIGGKTIFLYIDNNLKSQKEKQAVIKMQISYFHFSPKINFSIMIYPPNWKSTNNWGYFYSAVQGRYLFHWNVCFVL